MEELRSTEVLDKEIHDDSIRRAEKILAKAEESAKAILSEVESRIDAAEKEAQAASDSRIALFKKNVEAALPLEKQRFLVSFINDSIVEALGSYIGSLDESRKNAVIEKLVLGARNVTGSRKVSAATVGTMGKSGAEKILKSAFGSDFTGVEEGKSLGAGSGSPLDYGIILRTEDGKVMCRLTLEEKINELLGQKREMLALSLFGGRLPE